MLTYRNLLLTMLLGGLWHGAAWTFVVWGAIHGAGLAVERALGWRPTSTAARWFGRLLTFHVVCFALDLLPRRLVRARRGRCSSGSSRRGGSPRRSSRRRCVLAIVVGIGGQYVRRGALVAVLTRLRPAAACPPRRSTVGRLPDADQHARPRRGRAVHLLPLLDEARSRHPHCAGIVDPARSRSGSPRCSTPRGCASRRRSSRRASSGAWRSR